MRLRPEDLKDLVCWTKDRKVIRENRSYASHSPAETGIQKLTAFLIPDSALVLTSIARHMTPNL